MAFINKACIFFLILFCYSQIAHPLEHQLLAQTTSGETPQNPSSTLMQQEFPTATHTPQVITATPTPPNVFVAAGLVIEATANARTTGTATSTPLNWITATFTATPLVVTNTPAPGNDATATYQARLATAIAITTGTGESVRYVTATATPANQSREASQSLITALPTVTNTPTVAKPTATPVPPGPTATPQILVAIEPEVLVSTPRPTPTFPADLIGKILFQSRAARLLIQGRNANVRYFAIEGNGTGLSALRPEWNWVYARASIRDEYSANRQFRAFVQKEQDQSRKNQTYIFYEFYTYGTVKQLTFFGDDPGFPYDDHPRSVKRSLYGAWDPAWSPTAEKVALVSNESGNDEIWVVERDVWPAIQLTKDDWGAWDRHPSWSPDGNQIVFMSNRSGLFQLWMMNADGSEQRQLTNFENGAWNPVWVKYSDS